MERISVTATLNRSTLQFEEAAFARLERYLAEAKRTLEGNPDLAEILGDLEQAVADQCTKRLQPGQSVVTLAELEPALEEIGTVQAPGSPGPEPILQHGVRHLQQVSEGAWISGVCQGIARYLGADVLFVRLAAVLLLLVSGGGMILVYLLLMLLMPFAPPAPGGPPIGKLPEKSRRLVGFVRSKLGAAAT